MYKHVILWKLKEEYTDSQKAEIRKNAKENLESLNGKIPGMLSLKMNIQPEASSNCDMMLDAGFETYEALIAYGNNPIHVAIANKDIKPYAEIRMCLDYKED